MMRFLSILYPVLFTLILLASMNLARQHLPRLAQSARTAQTNRTAQAAARPPAALQTPAAPRPQDNATAALPDYVLNPAAPPRSAVARASTRTTLPSRTACGCPKQMDAIAAAVYSPTPGNVRISS